MQSQPPHRRARGPTQSRPGPSTIPERRSSLLSRSNDSYMPFADAAGHEGSTDASSDIFQDAEDSDYEDAPSSDFADRLSAFDPPPPRAQLPSARTGFGNTYANGNALTLHDFGPGPPSDRGKHPSSYSTLTGESREKVSHSNSAFSVTSSLRGTRAAAPAALDLSPGRTRTMQRWAVRDDSAPPDNESNSLPSNPTRLHRPLPDPPDHERLERHHESPDPAHLRNGAQPYASSSRALHPSSVAVPLSAFGDKSSGGPPTDNVHQSASVQTLVPKMEPTQSSLSIPLSGLESQSTSPVATGIPTIPSPLSPPTVDPANIDRRTLIGVGELATPRWTSSASHEDRSGSHRLHASPRDRVGLGFGEVQYHEVGGQRVVDENLRQRSVYQSKPSNEIAEPRKTVSTPAYEADLAGLLGSIGDFSFGSTVEAALAATLSIPNEPGQPVVQPLPPSPGTARSRIYARRLERERAAREMPVPQRSSSKLSPPSSAESQAVRRDTRKTPPVKERGYHSSPSHDILKHFAPRDFSHLPPSPSSASINQFLKTSASVNNFSSAGTPPTLAGSSSTYFSGPPTASFRADVDPETAEALRKLDGLSSTPRSKSKTRAGVSGTSRPATPPRLKSETRQPTDSTRDKASAGTESPLTHWLDVTSSFSAQPPPSDAAVDLEVKDSSSSISGTPNSNVVSLPTSSTTPSSGFAGKLLPRRSSAASDMSGDGPVADNADDLSIPPVPPLPKGFQSMRQLAPQSTTSPSDALKEARPRPVNKKWSFSSALNLRLGKESSAMSSLADLEEGSITSGPSLHDVEAQQVSPDTRSNQSLTPISSETITQTANPKTTSNKRLAPTSLPFFRRTSSSSAPKSVIPEVPAANVPPAKVDAAVSGSARKSMLGMHIPSMLRGSVSKRGLSQQLSPPQSDARDHSSSTWTGRQRGKTLSMTAEQAHAIMLSPKHLTPTDETSRVVGINTIVTPAPRLHGASNQSRPQNDSAVVQGTPKTSRNTLPVIQGSPALRSTASAVSLKQDTSRVTSAATPTRTSRLTSTPGSSMQPPSIPIVAKKASNTALSQQYSSHIKHASDSAERTLSEFGTLQQIRGSASGSHRAHLLAPMATRDSAKKAAQRPAEGAMNGRTQTLLPPSRRTLPVLPAAAAMTISAQAKRISRDVRPGLSRRGSKDTPSDTSSRATSPMKPSKSLHAKLSIPASSSTRLSPSPSVGAMGSTIRKASLLNSLAAAPVDDGSAIADSEMRAYVERRRAMAVAKNDDMADVNDFPEDIPPGTPVPQRAFVRANLAKMNDFERKEVLDYNEIYFSPADRIVRSSGGAIYNYGYDDERGDYIVIAGDHLHYRYEIVGVLGKGSFGQVLQCRDHKTGMSVAVKIIRNKKRFHSQAQVEVKILGQLVDWDPEDKHRMVRMTDSFQFRSHLCIVTEMLSINLYELIKANSFAGFSTNLIRRFTVQILSALQLMRSHRIVHCDLKPENILLCHPVQSAIKVIDFGSSCAENEKVYTYIQSRFYRSPEVILGMNYAMAIDMWSLGCILAELYTGVPIFPGENENEQLACIMEIMGVPDRHLVDKASRRKLFFDATGAPRPFVNAKGKRRRPGTRSLAQVLKCKDELFVDFIARCLTWDPDKRLRPGPATRHPWILAGRKRSSTIQDTREMPYTSNGQVAKSMISPPSSLIAKTSSSLTASRLAQPMSRSSSYMTASKIKT